MSLLFTPFLCVKAQYNKEGFYSGGQIDLAKKDYSAAIDKFNILTKIDSCDYKTYFLRGIAKYNLGDVLGARKDFDYSILKNPVFTEAYHYRGVTYSVRGEHDKAMLDYTKALELRPSLNEVYYSRGLTHFFSQSFQKALKDFDTFIGRNPDNPFAYLSRGSVYLCLKDTVKACYDYDKAIELDRFEIESYIRRATLYAVQKQYDRALEDFNKAVLIDSTSTLAHFNIAMIYYHKENYNASIASLEKVNSIDPYNALSLYNKSLIYAQMNDMESALANMSRVIDINPKNVLAYYNRAAFFAKKELWYEALEDYTTAISLYPDFVNAYLNRSRINHILGRNKEAEKDYRKAQKEMREYRKKVKIGQISFADTALKYSAILDLNADFSNKNFEREQQLYRDVNVGLRPLYRFVINANKEHSETNKGYRETSKEHSEAGDNKQQSAIEPRRALVMNNLYEHSLIELLKSQSSLPVIVSNKNLSIEDLLFEELKFTLSNKSKSSTSSRSLIAFLEAMLYSQNKQYARSNSSYERAIALSKSDTTSSLFGVYLMNKAVLRAEMTDFILSVGRNIQTLTVNVDSKTPRMRVNRVKDNVLTSSHDYSEILESMERVRDLFPDFSYVYFNLGNIYCLSSKYVEAINSYSKAIDLYPSFAESYYNRALVLIHVKEIEKAYLDLSKAGELGIREAYSLLKVLSLNSSKK